MKRNYNHLPFRPARLPFFYGWAILPLGTLGLLMTAPGQTYGFTAFVESLMEALALTREQLSWAYAAGTIGSSLLLSRAGRLYDRLGARFLAVGSAVGLGLAALWISASDHLAGVLATISGLWPVAASLGVITIGFFMARFFGQGVLMLACRTMISEWFDRRRGMVNGVSNLMNSFGFAALIPLLMMVCKQVGWRMAWRMMALLVGVVFALTALLLFRDTPESCGLHPDGDEDTSAGAAGVAAVSRQFTLGEARRSVPFWMFALTQAVFGWYMTGVGFHMISVFAKAGMGDGQIATLMFGSWVVSIGTTLVAGWMSDRVKLKYLLHAMQVVVAGAALALISLGPGPALWLMMVTHGMAGAMFGIVPVVVWPRFYGREHLGAISGQVWAMTVFASALGPVWFSLVEKHTGSYAQTGWTCLVAMLLLAVGTRKADSPQSARAPVPVAELAED